MPMSSYYQSVRDRQGRGLLMMPAVAAIVHDVAGRILLQLTHDDEWSLPAGAIEPGESPEDAVVREVAEGLHVSPARLVGVLGGSKCRVTYRNGDEVEYVVTVYECEIQRGSLRVQGETKSLQWFPPAEMPALAFSYPAAFFRGAPPVDG